MLPLRNKAFVSHHTHWISSWLVCHQFNIIKVSASSMHCRMHPNVNEFHSSCWPIQKPADPFNSRQTHSTAGRPIQQPADPFNSRQTHSTAGRPIQQRADPFNSQRRWLDPTTLRQMASPQPEGDLRDCIHVIHLTTTHSSHLLSSWRLRLVRRLLPSNPVSLSCSPRA